MVLKMFKRFCALTLILNLNSISFALADDESKSQNSVAFDQAVKEFKSGRFESCTEIISKNYSAEIQNGDLKNTALLSQCLLASKKIGEARKYSQNALKKRFSWWESFETAQKPPEGQALADLKALNQSSDRSTLHLIWLIGHSYGIDYSKTQANEKRKRSQLKEKVDFFYSTLIETSYNADKVEALTNLVSEKDDLLKKEVSKNGWSVSTGYLRYSLKYVIEQPGYSGKGVGGGPTLSLGAFNENFFREYSYGITFGRSSSNLQITNSPDYIQSASVNILGAYLQAIKKISESGSGFGINLQIGYFGFTGKLPNGYAINATNTEVIGSLIGRTAFYDIGYVDFKWGNSLRRGNTFWIVEIGRHF